MVDGCRAGHSLKRALASGFMLAGLLLTPSHGSVSARSVAGVEARPLASQSVIPTDEDIVVLSSDESHILFETRPALTEASVHEIEPGLECAALLIEGYGLMNQPGKPSLPARGALFSVPEGIPRSVDRGSRLTIAR